MHLKNFNIKMFPIFVLTSLINYFKKFFSFFNLYRKIMNLTFKSKDSRKIKYDINPFKY